ncbi:MAG: archaea-specific SMC-related protein [Halovenus sp.]
MGQSVTSLPEVHLSAANIGGIERASEVIFPGVTVLVGKNATNRTSLLQAIAAALGTDNFTLKRDAEAGEATLRVGNDEYVCRLQRENSHIERDCEPYVDEPELAELYAVLFGSNEIRQTVREGGDIRELIVRPLDITEINDRIGEIVTRRREIDQRLDQYDQIDTKLERKRAKRREYEAKLDDLDDQLERKRNELEAAQRAAEGQSQSEIEAELEAKLDTLRDLRADREAVEESLAVEQKSLESFREEREEIADQYDALSPPDEEQLATLDERIDQLRNQKRSLGSTISELQQVIRFNDDRLSESSPLAGERETTPELTDQQTVCWTCGSEVSRDRIEETLDRLRELHQQHSSERNRITDEIEQAVERRSELQETQKQYDELEAQLSDLEEKIRHRQSAIERLRSRRAELEDRIDEVEATVADLKQDRQSEVLALQEEVSELAFERRRISEQLDEVEAEIEQLQDWSGDRETLETEREELSDELTELRTRVDRLETEAVEAFNTHMAEILDTLEYDNIERIWLDPSQREIEEGSQTLTERVFELHVVRAADDGTVYEDRFEHLSESERELVGLVVALAGYLAHDAHERVPFMLLDSLEMVDGQRLVELASYLKEYVPYLVMVLLPDHAAAFADHETLPDHRITDI